MSIKKETLKSGETRWIVRYYTNGRGTDRKHNTFVTKADAQAFLEEILKEKRQSQQLGFSSSFDDTDFEKEAEFWLAVRGVNFSPGHFKRAQAIIKELLPRFGKINLREFSSQRLFRLQQEFLGQKSKPATVNRKTEVITAILKFSARNQRIPFYPAAAFQKLKESRTDIAFWERLEAEMFLDFSQKKYPVESPKRWIYLVYLLTINTGLRAGEVWGIKPKDIKQEGEVLHIQRQWDRVKKDFRLPKSKRARFVPCNEFLRKELMSWIQRQGIKPDQTIFQNEQGKPICHENFMKRSYLIDQKEAGVTSMPFHSLRHTGITLMLADGIDIKTVQELAGHADIDTTMKYVHLLADSVRKASRIFSVKPQETKPQLKLVVNHDQ